MKIGTALKKQELILMSVFCAFQFLRLKSILDKQTERNTDKQTGKNHNVAH